MTFVRKTAVRDTAGFLGRSRLSSIRTRMHGAAGLKGAVGHSQLQGLTYGSKGRSGDIDSCHAQRYTLAKQVFVTDVLSSWFLYHTVLLLCVIGGFLTTAVCEREQLVVGVHN